MEMSARKPLLPRRVLDLPIDALRPNPNQPRGTATQSDTVVVTTDNHYFVSSFRCAFQAVALCTVTNTTGKHDYFVVTINFFVFCMFESQYRTADQRLAELVTEVGSTIGCFD